MNFIASSMIKFHTQLLYLTYGGITPLIKASFSSKVNHAINYIAGHLYYSMMNFYYVLFYYELHYSKFKY